MDIVGSWSTWVLVHLGGKLSIFLLTLAGMGIARWYLHGK